MRRPSIKMAGIMVVFFLAAAIPSPAQTVAGPWIQQATLVSSDPQPGPLAGLPLALSADGTTAAVGAGAQDTQGAVDVFVQSGGTWVQQARLTASDAVPGDRFGGPLAVNEDGSTIVVGAIHGSSTGVAYVFVKSGGTWVQQAELTSC